ncbi:MAG: hypothetical protein HZA92_18440 [Verrucomicrobia bacterium]|nr:hypothetical protein [Verrucomicrobiota bacterium]
MRLVEAKEGLFVFHLAKRERVLLTQVMKMFPVSNGPIGPLSKSGDEAKLAEHELALAEALTEQRTEHKRLMDAFLGEQGRFAEEKNGFRLRLTTVQVDWLLRVLNEVRVGLWVQLGRPEELAPLVMSGQLDSVVAMEICAFFQSRLLAATEKGESN